MGICTAINVNPLRLRINAAVEVPYWLLVTCLVTKERFRSAQIPSARLPGRKLLNEECHCNPHQILVWWSNAGGWSEHCKWHAWREKGNPKCFFLAKPERPTRPGVMWKKWNFEKQKNECVKHRIVISSVWLFLSFRRIIFEDIITESWGNKLNF